MLGAGLALAARGLEQQPEQRPAHLLHRRSAGGDHPGVEIDQVVPAAGELGASAHLDDRHRREIVGRATTRREHVHVDASRDLQRAANEIARGRRGKYQATPTQLLPGREQPQYKITFTTCSHTAPSTESTVRLAFPALAVTGRALHPDGHDSECCGRRRRGLSQFDTNMPLIRIGPGCRD